MRILLIEAGNTEQLSPLAWTRPVFELLCGTRCVRQRILDVLSPDEWGVVIRPHLAEVYRLEHPDAHVNDPQWIDADDVLIVDGRWGGNPFLLASQEGQQGFCEQRIVSWLRIGKQGLPDLTELCRGPQRLSSPAPAAEQTAVAVGGVWLDYPWDLVRHNGDLIKLDFELLQLRTVSAPRLSELPDGVTRTSNLPWISIHSDALIEPFVCMNAQAGPIIIEAGVHIHSFSRLEGPCYIGQDSQILGARIRGETSIGPVCRVGGEIEASILHGYANKYHDGFLGHSYVCPWVNLGALTTNSDLKNDYSTVKVPVGTEYVATGEKKVGCFIGDHAKTAIGTLFNTGSSIGVMAMVLPAGRLCPKHIPSFCRLWQGVIDDQLDFAAACETARVAMSRRGAEFLPAHERMLTEIRALTAGERALALGSGHAG